MQLIAKRAFKNPGRKLSIKDALHPDHVHKGATFSIGTEKEVKNLNGDDQKMVLLLNVADCLGDATDEKIVRAVQAEVAAEKKAEAAQAVQAAK